MIKPEKNYGQKNFFGSVEMSKNPRNLFFVFCRLQLDHLRLRSDGERQDPHDAGQRERPRLGQAGRRPHLLNHRRVASADVPSQRLIHGDLQRGGL